MRSLMRFAVLSDTHLAPPGTPDGIWNNVTCLSASNDLLSAAVAEIASAGIGHIALLGDVSDRGDPGMIAAALRAVTGAGMHAWAVPGNHDVSVSPDALTEAVKRSPGSTVIREERLDGWPDVTVCGHTLHSDDGGNTCEATACPILPGSAPGWCGPAITRAQPAGPVPRLPAAIRGRLAQPQPRGPERRPLRRASPDS